MKIHKFTIYAFDFENDGVSAIAAEFKNMKHVNCSISNAETKDVPDWDDNHPMNKLSTDKDKWWEEN